MGITAMIHTFGMLLIFIPIMSLDARRMKVLFCVYLLGIMLEYFLLQVSNSWLKYLGRPEYLILYFGCSVGWEVYNRWIMFFNAFLVSIQCTELLSAAEAKENNEIKHIHDGYSARTPISVAVVKYYAPLFKYNSFKIIMVKTLPLRSRNNVNRNQYILVVEFRSAAENNGYINQSILL